MLFSLVFLSVNGRCFLFFSKAGENCTQAKRARESERGIPNTMQYDILYLSKVT